MNFIAGYFLLYGMTEEEAFAAMIRLLLHPNLMMLGFYEENYPLAKLYILIFWAELRRRQTKLAAKI